MYICLTIMPLRPPKIAFRLPKKQLTKSWSGDGFYQSSAWRKLAAYHKNIDPLCRECLKIGKTKTTDVSDHILPREQHPHLELELFNLQGLCYHHHAVKSGKEKKNK